MPELPGLPVELRFDRHRTKGARRSPQAVDLPQGASLGPSGPIARVDLSSRARGVRQLGRGLSSLGASLADIETDAERNASISDTQQRKLALFDAKAQFLIDQQDQTVAFQDEQDNADPGAPDFTQNRVANFDALAKSRLDALPEEVQGPVGLLYMQEKHRQINNARKFQRGSFRKAVGDKLGDAGNAILQKFASTRDQKAALKDFDELVDSVDGLPNSDKESLKRGFRGNLATESLNDPDQDRTLRLLEGQGSTLKLQKQVERWHFSDIDTYARKHGVNKLYGKTIGGVRLSANGFRAMAHLGGKGGALKFIKSGGKSDPADSNGTRLSDYGRRYEGGDPVGRADDSFINSLAGGESGGRLDAQNNAMGAGGKRGHFGRLQFGHARLSEASKALGVKISPDEFMGKGGSNPFDVWSQEKRVSEASKLERELQKEEEETDKDRRAVVEAEIYDNLFEDTLTQDMLDAHKDELSPGTYRKLTSSLLKEEEGEERNATFLEISDLIGEDNEQATQATRDAFVAGEITRGTFNSLNRSIETSESDAEKRPGVSDIRAFLKDSLKSQIGGIESQSQKERRLEAVLAFDDVVRKNPDMPRGRLIEEAKKVRDAFRSSKKTKARSELDLPRFARTTTGEFNMEEAERAGQRTVDALEKGTITYQEAAEQAKLLRKWISVFDEKDK